jgi:hypothetical protein
MLSFLAASMKPHDDVGLLGVLGWLRAAVGELREIALGIDGVLVAAECDDGNFHAVIPGNARDLQVIDSSRT